VAARHRKESKRRRRTKPPTSLAASKVDRLLRSDFQRASRKFVEELTNYSWNWDESPFRGMDNDNGGFFRDAMQRLRDSLKSAIQKRFNDAWAIYRNMRKTTQADAAELSGTLIRNSVAGCWSLKAVLQQVPEFLVV